MRQQNKLNDEAYRDATRRRFLDDVKQEAEYKNQIRERQNND